MKTRSLPVIPIRRASQALIALLGQISAFRHQNIRIEFPQATPPVDLLACVELLGRSHTLACAFRESDSGIEGVIAKLRRGARKLGNNIRPVFIAPRLSATAQAFCRSQEVDYFDLEGNARIHLGELFIALQTSSGTNVPSSKPEEIWKLPPEFSVRADTPAPTLQAIA